MSNQATTTQAPTQAAALREITEGVQKLEAQVSQVGDSLHDLNERAVRFIEERPLAAIGIAFGVGYLVGKLASRRWLV